MVEMIPIIRKIQTQLGAQYAINEHVIAPTE